jgi:hypothetical protein
MKPHSVLVAALSFLAVACGGPQGADGETSELGTQQAALSGPLLGTWCQEGWPSLCINIHSDGNAYISNSGDWWCWWPGDQVFSGLTGVSGPGSTMGTRLMSGRGTCNPPGTPESVVITMYGNDYFLELTENGYSGYWYRAQ